MQTHILPQALKNTKYFLLFHNPPVNIITGTEIEIYISILKQKFEAKNFTYSSLPLILLKMAKHQLILVYSKSKIILVYLSDKIIL